MTVNIFIALSTSAKTAVNTRLRWDTEKDGEYTGPVTETERKIFARMAHHKQTGSMWKNPTFLSKSWTLYSLNFDNPTKNLKRALDFLEANRAGLFRVVGAWRWIDGLQVGLSYDEDGDVTGTPVYPIPPQLLSFMPDIIERDEDGNVISTTLATQLTDVNLVQGQAPRIWT